MIENKGDTDMNLTFNAISASYIYEDGVHVLGLGDHAQNPRDYVIFQWDKAPADPDEALGEDGYYVEICENGAAGYGGVEAVFLSETILEVRLSKTVSWYAGLDSVTVNLTAVSANWCAVRDALRQLFEDSNAKMRIDGPSFLKPAE